jgi:hypothetical protein
LIVLLYQAAFIANDGPKKHFHLIFGEATIGPDGFLLLIQKPHEMVFQ